MNYIADPKNPQDTVYRVKKTFYSGFDKLILLIRELLLKIIGRILCRGETRMSIVDELLSNKVQENQTLEYKEYNFENGKFNSLEQKQRSTLIKEICAFANAQGGTLILGIGEDENHNPTAAFGTGVTGELFEQWEQSFRLFCKTKIRPVLHGIDCTSLEHNGVHLIRIEVPTSILKPHAFYDGNRDEFYIRYGNICNHMSYDDLKRSFTELESIQSKISNFRDNRLSMILNDEVAGGLMDNTSLVVHIVPHWSMGLSNYIDLNLVKNDPSFDVFSPTSTSGVRNGELNFNTDGMMVSYGYGEFPTMSYSQLFHNGAIESVEVRMMNFKVNAAEEKHIYKWREMEELLYQKCSDFCNTLEKVDIPKPYSIFVSILNAKGKQTRINNWNFSQSLTRDIIKSIPAYISEDSSFDEALVPLFTSLANSFGMERSLILKK